MEKTFYIIDDHEILRSGICVWLSANSAWLCAGQAGTHEKAYNDLEKMNKKSELPAIVICDLNFYGENTGFDFIKEIKALYPDLKIIVYSMFFAAGMVQSAIKAGACGYVSKNASSLELEECMEKALAGQIFIQDELQSNLTKYNDFTDALTQREKDVMELLLQRFSNDEIANRLGIKKRSVENYISLIYEKTGAFDRNELVEKYGQ
ncbi:MAG: response regulator transcription factor [Treponema sp.]|nr:response regulator transcription factor [Treponema sp.]